jgi:hypothetical protein
MFVVGVVLGVMIDSSQEKLPKAVVSIINLQTLKLLIIMQI